MKLMTVPRNLIVYITDMGAENAEVCQWTFFGQGRKKAEVS